MIRIDSSDISETLNEAIALGIELELEYIDTEPNNTYLIFKSDEDENLFKLSTQIPSKAYKKTPKRYSQMLRERIVASYGLSREEAEELLELRKENEQFRRDFKDSTI